MVVVKGEMTRHGGIGRRHQDHVHALRSCDVRGLSFFPTSTLSFKMLAFI